MKAAVLWSSPNLDGLTASAMNQVLEGLHLAEIDTAEVHLNEMTLRHCEACENGWGKCAEEGVCVQQDDLEQIYKKMEEADGLVFITAVYWHDMTECMKSFLDRLRRCETRHNHFLKGKPCLLVACAGGSGNGAVHCLLNMEDYMRHMELVPCDRLPVIRYNRSYMLPALHAAGQAFGMKLKEKENA